MRTLPDITPTPEQLPLIQNTRPGVSIIRGAAGSGKTTTALLRLKQLAATWLARRQRLDHTDPVRILVITFNRTLRGYIAELAEQQVRGRSHLDLTVSTFSKWARDCVANAHIVEDSLRRTKLHALCGPMELPNDFLLDEVDYVLSRFQPDALDDYVDCERTGRGATPRVDRSLRRQILDEVIRPYDEWKNAIGRCDWNDLATNILTDAPPIYYDVIIADEVQDLSANQVRALLHVAADPSSVTFVLDGAQRIYPRGFAWKEVGLIIRAADSHRLKKNYRNTKETCRFASPLLQGIDIGDDGTLPDFNTCVRSGAVPVVLKGKYSGQANYAMTYLATEVDLQTESVAFLHPLGYGWFSTLRRYLDDNSYAYIEISREEDWPSGPENIALSTMHSAKGLEFDHVIIIGLNAEVTPHGSEPDDDDLVSLRRLLAMSITRARKSVLLGYKPTEASGLISLLDEGTFQEVAV